MAVAARAVVVGAGMGGLFAARVLSDHVEQVVVVDRDPAPTTIGPRGGVPQGNHFHMLLPGGMEAAATWFPGIADQLTAAGAVPTVLGRDIYAFLTEGKSYVLARYQPEPVELGRTCSQTRPLLEAVVRRQLEALPNVSFMSEVVASGVVAVDGRVRGLRVRDGEPIAADLVVDATGRQSATPAWLAELGYEQPAESVVNCGMRYTSVLLEPRDPDALEGTGFFVMPPANGERPFRLGTLVRVEGDRWLAGLGGRYDDAPPTDLEGYRAFGRTLQHPVWDELVGTATPLGRPVPYHLARAVRRHYERLERFPDGLLPIGDAICFYNPTYGQGMSAAAGQCRALEAVLARRGAAGRGIEALGLEALPEIAEWVRTPWIVAASEDFKHPDCSGDFPAEDLPDFQALGTLGPRLATEPEVARVLTGVMQLRLPLSAVRTVVA